MTEKDRLVTEEEQKPSLLKKIEGAAEIAIGVLLVGVPVGISFGGVVIFPSVAWAVAAAGCVGLTAKKFYDEPKASAGGKPRTWGERFSAALGMVLGTTVGMCTMIGAAAIALVGIKEAWMGNAASFDMVQGAIWGAATSVVVPAVGVVLIGEGAYKAVTGKPCNVLSATYDMVKSTCITIGNFCGLTQKPTQENVQTATKTAAVEVAASAAKVKGEVAKDQERNPGFYQQMRDAGSSLVSYVSDMVHHTGSSAKPGSTPGDKEGTGSRKSKL